MRHTKEKWDLRSFRNLVSITMNIMSLFTIPRKEYWVKRTITLVASYALLCPELASYSE